MEYVLSPAELIPTGKGYFPLEKNNVYIQLLKLKQELEQTRNSMEPYFQKYGPLFRSVTSNFGPFKSTRFHISKRYNTPSVSNVWIIMYEIISHFNIIPEKIHKKFIHFNSENLPGSNILSIYHFINTMRDTNFKKKTLWLGSAPINLPLYKGDDIYKLIENYSNQWVMSDNFLSTSKDNVRNFESSFKSAKDKYIPNGDITDINYTKYVKTWLIEKLGTVKEIKNITNINSNNIQESEPKINLFTGNIYLETGKNYNNEELIHNKIFLGQIFLCFNILKQGGNAILKNTTFFSLFNISLLAFISQHFKKCIVYKPMSSKKDSSEIFLICKDFNGTTKEEINNIEKILMDPNFDYDYGQLLKVNKITQNFWLEIADIMDIFKRQIYNINKNIYNFNMILKKQSYYERHNNTNTDFDETKILKDSQKKFFRESGIENIKWGELHPIKPLHKKDWINVHNTTKPRFRHLGNKSTSIVR